MMRGKVEWGKQRHNPNKHEKQHQQYYLKKLHTESFASPELEEQIGRLTEKLEKEIQAVKRRMRVKNLKMFRAKEKLKAIEQNQEQQRETLRDTLHQKMILSQSKLNDSKAHSNSRSASREKLRQTTLMRIQTNRKQSQEESFRKSQQFSQDQRTFLLQRKLSQSRSRPSITRNTQFTVKDEEDSRKFQSAEELEPRKKLLPKVLKVSDREIRKRQTRKINLEESKAVRNLQEYVQKLNSIEAKRNTRTDRLSDTANLIQKQRNQQQHRHQSQQKRQEEGYSRKKAESLGRPFLSATKQAIDNKYSFSQFYAKKLEQSLSRKASLQERAMREAEKLMERQAEKRAQRRQSRLVGDTIKEVQRRFNFRYMERFRS